MEQLSPDQIKAIELDVMKELHRICTDHGLTYCLAYGTALGAVRHGGFIPWDDDIDVYMPRPDYERLWDLFQQGLETPYQLVSYRDKSSIYQFFKLVDPTTRSYETFVGRSRPIGLWVDIFPLEPADGASPAELDRVRGVQQRVGLWRSFAVADPTIGATRAAVVAKRLVGPFARRSNVYELARKLDENAQSVTPKRPEGAPASFDALYDDVIGDNCTVDGSLLFPPVPIAFEDTVFQGPAKPEAYLDFQYGNWREFPPESERRLHFPEAYLLDDSE